MPLVIKLLGSLYLIQFYHIIDSPSRHSRDNSFVRYELLPDANASIQDAPDVPVRRVQYGRLLDIYYVEFITDVVNDVRAPYLLARVKDCQTDGLDAALPENPLVIYQRIRSPEIIHLDAITYVVGRVEIAHNTWAIIDRSTNGARTQFVDPNGEPEDFE
ncbi:hypothetical protein RSOLAG22IIIB_09405 [Rhizoctonia solani]|uniref:Uncharacterized protein n=1 Tax=Rhizoctonia solani TaxID=456999 RepID=A0A0K6FYF9_9AGAM|nr:hypothetical protein RSOLAG22IIIB_09405 [Rhizoctonia solani]